jgi:hypothetical protein
MGGPGSGNRWRWGSRDTCEGYTRISLSNLKRRGLLHHGCFGSLSWSCGGEPAGNIRFRMHESCMELVYKYRRAGSDEWSDVNERIPFDFTRQHFGGRRQWFRCLSCHRRCAVLYGGTHYRCRKCWGLAYQSQHQNAHSRAVTKAGKLRMRLGGSECTDDPFPDKPKGMHRRTYERLRAKGERLDDRADNLGWVRLERLLGVAIS